MFAQGGGEKVSQDHVDAVFVVESWSTYHDGWMRLTQCHPEDFYASNDELSDEVLEALEALDEGESYVANLGTCGTYNIRLERKGWDAEEWEIPIDGSTPRAVREEEPTDDDSKDAAGR